MDSRLTSSSAADLICLSHLRWNFVFQRPQHLMTRCARERRVFFVEEPIVDDVVRPFLEVYVDSGVTVVVPHLPDEMSAEATARVQRTLLAQLMQRKHIRDYVLWYYTPMALAFTNNWSPRSIIYDCMDELTGFNGAPPELKQREAELMRRASLVLTGGQSLYEAKRHAHRNIHPVPSSVDAAHFQQARGVVTDPPDQAVIARPRLGFFGVIDERMDLELIEGVAALRPDWQIVMLGPVVKIAPSTLPQMPNIHYLGPKSYDRLPDYIAGWDVALMPFARNEATRFISPTKTPEYMAAGKPVVSTSIRDVVRPYGQADLVRIADDPASFVEACAEAMAENAVQRETRNDLFLKQNSWDSTWRHISTLMDEASGSSDQKAPAKTTPSQGVQSAVTQI